MESMHHNVFGGKPKRAGEKSPAEIADETNDHVLGAYARKLIEAGYSIIKEVDDE